MKAARTHRARAWKVGKSVKRPSTHKLLSPFFPFSLWKTTLPASVPPLSPMSNVEPPSASPLLSDLADLFDKGREYEPLVRGTGNLELISVSSIPRPGLLLTLSSASRAPRVTFTVPRSQTPGESSSTYTVLCVDPDAPDPSLPAARSWLHLVLTGVKTGARSTTVVVDSDEAGGAGTVVVVPWSPPAPPIGTHRYIFLVFEEGRGGPTAAAAAAAEKPLARGHFHLVDFAARNGLRLIGLTYMRVRAQEEGGE
jgi:phosphatidylethanolamine-binding protein